MSLARRETECTMRPRHMFYPPHGSAVEPPTSALVKVQSGSLPTARGCEHCRCLYDTIIRSPPHQDGRGLPFLCPLQEAVPWEGSYGSGWAARFDGGPPCRA